ncbi:Reverse transcriptase zinc-binding domain [Sesbania bispinosa]|nr:Reverse transcriptase zinc-binding domain [Sesbania bispinosa]
MWNHVIENICWILGDGLKTCFWTDTFIPQLGPLLSHTVSGFSPANSHIKAACFADQDTWNWNTLNHSLSPEALQHLSSIPPPSLDTGPDKPVWKLEGNGEFSLKSAFTFLQQIDDNNSSQDPIFNHIWKWQGPPRITTFIWKLIHGRLLTNLERSHRGMATDDSCHRCSSAPESIMHVIRDCPIVFEFWETIIEPAECSSPAIVRTPIIALR